MYREQSAVGASERERLRHASAVGRVGHHTGHEVALILLDREVRHRRGHGDLDLPPAPGGVTREKRADDAKRRVQARHRIGGCRTDDARRLRRDEHAQESRQRLSHRVVSRTIDVRSVATEPRDRAIHEARIALHDLRRTEPEALDHTRTKVLDVHVGALEQLPHQRAVRVLRKVELDAPLVAVERLELRPVHALLEAAERVAAPGTLDLDHVRPHVGQEHCGVRPGDELGVLDHATTREHLPRRFGLAHGR